MEEDMRAVVAIAGLALVCAGCVQTAPPPVAVAGPGPVMPAAAPDCRTIKATTTIDGKQQELTGLACRNADGSWRMAGEQPIYLLPPYAYAYDPGWMWWWSPIGLGAVSSFALLEVPHDHFRRGREHDRDFFIRDHDGNFRGGHSRFMHHG
jgi:hypothetical protein